MKTLIKAILKFFKLNKLSFIGLFILVFFSMTIFTVLNSTNANLTSSYQNVATEGNLHDFVINEDYRYGQGPYQLNTNSSDDSSVNGDVKVTSISSYDSTSGVYNVTFTLDTALTSSGQNYEWTYAYNSVLTKYGTDTTSDFYNQYVSFTQSISSSDSSITIDNWTSNSDFVSTASSAISVKSANLDTYVENYYQQEFINTVETQTNTSIRTFNSLNISNTQQNIFFKLIESSPDYQIDKIVVYDGNNLTAAKDFSDVDSVINATSASLTSDASLSRSLVPYLYKAEWSSSSVDFSALYNYVNENPDYNPYTNTPVANDEVTQESQLLKTIVDNSDGIIDDSYQIRFSYTIAGLAPVSGKYTDPTSYGAIISPDYMKKLGKTPVNYQDWLDHLDDSEADFNAWLYTLSKNTFQIDNQTFVILGTGVSPDFMYPIVSFSNLVPNSASEQVVYTNSTGYAKMLDSFRGNEQENFLVGKFDGTNTSLNSQTLSDINEIATQYMAWPSNTKAAYMYNDTSNTVSPTALRVVFIPQVVSTITLVSAFLTTFILLLSVIISIVIIKRCIETNRNSLGIMQANGYKKHEIIIGVCLLIWIPVFFSIILGYILGLSLQTLTLDLLGSFWTLPTSIEGFSLLTIIPIVLIVSLIFLGLTIIFSWLGLRGETSEFMKDEAKYKMSKISIIFKKPFGKFSILTRLRASIAFASFWRLLLLSCMTALLMSSLSFSINSLNGFSDAAKNTYSVRNYTYSLSLVTPTLQSGQYYTVPYQQQGKTLDKRNYFDTSLTTYNSQSDNYLSQEYWQTGGAYASDASNNSVFGNYVSIYGNYQLVSQDDLNSQKTDLFYLKNKTTTKAFTNISLGAGSVSTNPWSIADQLLPTNNATYANQAYVNMFENAVADNQTQVDIGETDSNGETETDTLYDYIKAYTQAYAVLKSSSTDSSATPIVTDFGGGNATVVSQDTINSNTDLFYDSIDSNNDPNYDYYLAFSSDLISGGNSSVATTVDVNFLNLLYYLYANQQYSDYTYSINYGKLVTSQQDSPYTDIQFSINSVNDTTINSADELNLIGLSNNDTDPDVELINQQNQLVNDKLWTTATSTMTAKNADNQNEVYNVYPIIINEYARKKYNLHVGDVIQADIKNAADRFSRSYFGKDDPIAYFKIIDVATTYQGAEFYIDQYDANKILGLTINNIKPAVPTSASMIKDYVSWDNLEYDYGNNYLEDSPSVPSDNAVANLTKANFVQSESGFNGIFSKSSDNLAEVTNGISLYSFSGLYPGTSLISTTDSTMQALFSDTDNIKKAIQVLGFDDLLDSSGNPTVDGTTLIEKIASVFGSSSSFFIVNSATSNTSSLDVLNTTSQTLTKIQDAVLSLIVIIVVLIIVVISSLIINDSLKLAAILKCLGLDDQNNAASFLAVYLPVFLIGLLISIPLTLAFTTIYVNFIFSFAGILIVINAAWWHFLISSIGIIIIFFLSYWTTWNKIGRMNLSKSIK